MRVLILTTDLYNTVGGGQTAYRKLIEANREVDFVYFRVAESIQAHRPANATCVDLVGRRFLRPSDGSISRVRLRSLRTADAFARSVSGEQFDIVELPDYIPLGVHLRERLQHHKVRFRAIVLSMHGNISMSIRLGWNSDERAIPDEEELEYEQFIDAGARYALSKRYIREWQVKANVEVFYIDPLGVVDVAAPLPWVRDGGKPNLYCVGRTERRKGNDLFVEIARWLDPRLYGKAYHVGPVEYSRTGLSSRSILDQVAHSRGSDIGFLPTQEKQGLASIYGGDSLVILPVRYDSLNLVALESLFSGCPTVISTGAGACDYLDEVFPRLPYIKLDLGNFYGAVAEIDSALRGYDGYRRRLIEHLLSLKSEPRSLKLLEFYDAALLGGRQSRPPADRSRAMDIRQWPPFLTDAVLDLVRRTVPDGTLQTVQHLIRHPKDALVQSMHGSKFLADAKLVWHGVHSLGLKRRFATIGETRSMPDELAVRTIHELPTTALFRCNIWRELARVEQRRGNELVAASYEVRLMRMLGGDRFAQLPAVTALLEKNGFGAEARACRVLYGPSDEAEECVYDYLCASYEKNLHNQPREWELCDDRRTGAPIVSVIVSLYNAAPKLKLFLTALSLQTLVRNNLVEIVLVDSGSKDNEHAVIREFLSCQPLNLAYARSKERETIQAAWNRGIHLARAPYLVFLGVDETLYPEALEVLAGELDRDSSVDWVMANSLVTEVDGRGVFKRDVMPYDRTGGTKDHAYLETCYLSWVGGMYRKSIHQRFGYYDETFRAAGDTEFKNRVLPHINVKFIPRVLGLFLNYPDERTTASPVAEIEDTRAWYIHRSPGGVRYAFEHRDPADALRLFYAALGYRKSFCRHTSTDSEYAIYLLEYVCHANIAPELNPLDGDLRDLLNTLRGLEWTEGNFAMFSPATLLTRTWLKAKRLQKAHSHALSGKAAPEYKIFNDNRFEQHSWLWKTIP